MADLFSVEGKTAVVTGGSRGIGLMIARGLLQAGARVYITSRKADVCDAAAADLGQFGECISVPSDLSTRGGADHLHAGVAAREERVHILVNNAGAAWGAPIDEYPEDGWDKVLDTNVKGVFFTTQLFLPLLRAAATEQDRASVVNIGSVDGLSVPAQESFAYSTSKAAVHMLTRHLARRLVGENINVNAIAPGLFPSKMTAFMYETPELEKATLQGIPMHRQGGQAYVTGAVIPVSGGLATLS